MPFRPTTRAIRTVTRRVLLGAALTATVLFARAGHGGEGDSNHARAVELFEQSEGHYREGELEKAQELLLRAYELDPNPVLQFNLGRVYEGLGKLEEAAEAFRAFLAGSPEAPDRGAIERRIQALDKQIAERRALRERNRRPPTPPPAPPKSPPEPQDTGPGAAPWIVAGVGAVVLVGGTVSGLLAQRAHDDAEQDPSFQGAKDAQARAENFATAANVGFAVGGAAVAVGLGWALFDKSGQPDSTAATLGGPATFVFRGRF
jgi:tetratricopeptide (TPR) repeat protein